jgi:polar amino acid transport system substrate-binding protein
VATRARSGLLVLLVCLACSLPRDADDTLKQVRHGVIRVGASQNPPWVVISGGAVGGVEPALVTALASRLESRIQWVVGPESDLMQQLHDRDLDLLVAGLTAETPWKKKVAVTRPYYTDSVAVSGAPTGDLRNRTVAIEADDPAAAALRKKKAIPEYLRDLRDAPGPVAAPTWHLAALGRQGGTVLLQTRPRVMAVAPGENAWLMEVERLLYQKRADIPRMLRSAAP